MNLDEIRTLAYAQGVDFFGVADLTPAMDAIVAQGSDDLARFPRAVSIGKTLVHTIVDTLSDPPNVRSAQLYRYYCFDVVNDLLDKAALQLASAIQAAGFAAMPIPAAHRAVDLDRLCGIFSNKLAAHMAGLGWIGKSCLLITPEVGPRVRWASILTDAPIPPTGWPMAAQCGECQLCVKACPASAFTGRPFFPEEDRDARFRASACAQHLETVKHKIGESICGMCLKVCPHGAKKWRNKPIS